MRRIIFSFVAAAALAVALVGSAMAQDVDCSSGQAFAQSHVVALAQQGELGAGGHISGTHQGFVGLCELPANP